MGVPTEVENKNSLMRIAGLIRMINNSQHIATGNLQFRQLKSEPPSRLKPLIFLGIPTDGLQ